MEITQQHPVASGPLFIYLPWQAVHSPYDLVPGFDCETKYPPYPGVCKSLYTSFLSAFCTSLKGGVLLCRRRHAERGGYIHGPAARHAEAARDVGQQPHRLLVRCAQLTPPPLRFFPSDPQAYADNGGVSENGLAGVNYPLRGEKHTNWAGGYRVAAFVSGGVVPAALRGTSSNLRLHVVDWSDAQDLDLLPCHLSTKRLMCVRTGTRRSVPRLGSARSSVGTTPRPSRCRWIRAMWRRTSTATEPGPVWT